LHCSIIGTCLSIAELRQTLAKMGLARDDRTDHELHHQGVSLAARHDQAAKLLQKTLDRRHKLAISQFGKAETADAVRTLWRDAVNRGDIPGGYWATLTHPATTRDLARQAFGEVHMLSHLVGAANRADIRRLCDLEQRNAALEAKLSLQQEALHRAVVTRDASIDDLRDALRQKLRAEPEGKADGEAEALRALVANLEKQLAHGARRHANTESRFVEARTELARIAAQYDALKTETIALRSELAVLEFATLELGSGEENPETDLRLDGLSLLYVGGRPNQIAHLRALAERHGGSLLHNDGGVEHNMDLLAGLTSRADIVFFPVDCISHHAALNVKRLCRQPGKQFIPLRSTGTAPFLAALRRLEPAAATAIG